MVVKQGLGERNIANRGQEWRNKVVVEAKSWVGTPHRHYTLNKGLGTDCGMFIIGVYAKLGLIKEEKPDFYPEDWAWHKPVGEMFELIVQKYCVEIKKEEMQPGDLILYQFGKCLSHSSLLLKDDFIIHSERGVGVTISNRYSTRWYKRERKYYSYID